MIKLLLLKLVKSLATMLITETMILWLLGIAAKHTDNKIDDNVVLIVKGAYSSDVAMLKLGVEGLLASFKD